MALAKNIGDAVGAFVSEAGKLFGEERVGEALSEVGRGLARTKARVDDNVETALGLVNLPSKGELDRLAIKIDALQRSVSNLGRKIDRVAEQLERLASERPDAKSSASSASSESSGEAPRS